MEDNLPEGTDVSQNRKAFGESAPDLLDDTNFTEFFIEIFHVTGMKPSATILNDRLPARWHVSVLPEALSKKIATNAISESLPHKNGATTQAWPRELDTSKVDKATEAPTI
ncbi:hypothetical protein AB1A65_17650 [Muricauda sp. ANG21]|uniref:hypothetical protein n=1 Tax=Allomuricauda sp. ANG21 TaxID=3042468 RepID=UPI0034544FD9